MQSSVGNHSYVTIVQAVACMETHLGALARREMRSAILGAEPIQVNRRAKDRKIRGSLRYSSVLRPLARNISAA